MTGVVIASADTLAAGALAAALRRMPDVDVAVAVDVAGLASALEIRPELVVADCSFLEALGGPDLVFELGTGRPPVRCLVLVDVEDVDRMVDLLEGGAMGCVTRDQGLAEFVGAAESALRGEPTVPPWLLGSLLRQLVLRRRAEAATVRRFGALSPREREVLGLLAAGHDQDEIADILVISPQTVRTHIQRVTSKLGVRSRVHAAHVAAEYGLVDRRVRTGSTGGTFR